MIVILSAAKNQVVARSSKEPRTVVTNAEPDTYYLILRFAQDDSFWHHGLPSQAMGASVKQGLLHDQT
jgi:hypothetical protein